MIQSILTFNDVIALNMVASDGASCEFSLFVIFFGKYASNVQIETNLNDSAIQVRQILSKLIVILAKTNFHTL